MGEHGDRTASASHGDRLCRKTPAGTLTRGVQPPGLTFRWSHSSVALRKRKRRAGWISPARSLAAGGGGREGGCGRGPPGTRSASRGSSDLPAWDALAAACAHNPHFVSKTLHMLPRQPPWISLSVALFLHL